MKFDKLALTEGKILNLMFLDIKNIPVLPIEIQKNSESRFSLIIPPYFKDQIVARMWL